MALTRAAIEEILIARLGVLLAQVELDGVTIGDNRVFNDPAAWAMRMLGYSPASVANATDADLASVVSTRYDALIDLAELRTLEKVLSSMTHVDVRVGPLDEKRGSLATRVQEQIADKRRQIALSYGDILDVPLGDTPGGTVLFKNL